MELYWSDYNIIESHVKTFLICFCRYWWVRYRHSQLPLRRQLHQHQGLVLLHVPHGLLWRRSHVCWWACRPYWVDRATHSFGQTRPSIFPSYFLSFVNPISSFYSLVLKARFVLCANVRHSRFLADINECDEDGLSEVHQLSYAHNCHADANCTDTKGSFYCTCHTGYSGDGVTCEGASIVHDDSVDFITAAQYWFVRNHCKIHK